MASTSSVLSDTLQSITVTKIKELEKQRDSYNTRKHKILASTDDEAKDVRARVTTLLDGIQDMPGTGDKEATNELRNIRRWLDQAAYDPSIPDAKLTAFESELRSRLDKGSRKLDLAHLYSRLLTEWIETPAAPGFDDDKRRESGSDDSFVEVKDTQKARLEQLRDKFADVVFNAVDTDPEEIEGYLRKLFDGDHGKRALTGLREAVSEHGKALLQDSHHFDDQALKWCIKDLLNNELLNEEKKATLNDFLKDDAVMSEIRDVLNMRLRDLKEWQWNLGEQGMPVVPRQALNGKWRVMMDEDVLQALLTHWIGMDWAVCVKQALVSTRFNRKLWKTFTRIPENERAKRQYYFTHWDLKRMTNDKSFVQERQRAFDEDFFLSPLPSSLFEGTRGYMEDDQSDDGNRKSAKEIKQLLLRTIASQVIMRRSLDGDVAVVQSDFQWFATGIPHSTIFAVMRFVGFQEEWITFFRKVLEPPLNMLDGNPVRIRKRGLPMAHIMEQLLGELVLYFLDLAVAQNAYTPLYRFHDDLWLVDKPGRCAAAWKQMEQFAKVMGLEFNKNKTGSVYLTNGMRNRDSNILKTLPEGPVVIAFLMLDADSGTWKINQKHVQEHVRQLKKQLDDSKSVLQWIKTWNSCIGRFFSYTFGEPAHCFGVEHIDQILETHLKMQDFLFNGDTSGKNVTKHVRRMIQEKFDIDEVPDSFIFMPESLGGLGLKNPFIPLLLLRDDVCKDPEIRMEEFHKKEREEYETAKKAFEELSEKERRNKFKTAFEEYPPFSWEDAQTFMSFEDFAKVREWTSDKLHETYTYLMDQPAKKGVARTEKIMSGIKALADAPAGLAGGSKQDFELLWMVQLYGDELFEKFGGLEVVDRGLLPIGVLKALKARRVAWQMVL